MKTRLRTELKLALIFSALCIATCPVGLAAERPNIVVIMADDMGYGDVGAYNSNSKIPTPHLDRLAAEGMRFTDAHSPGSVCVPSRYGLLTGQYPHRVSLNWRREPCIAEDRLTVPAALKRVGYHTVMVGKWHLGFTVGEDGLEIHGGPVDRGFDTFFGIPQSTDIPDYYYIEGNRIVEKPTVPIEANSSDDWSPIQGAFWREGGIAPGMRLEDVLPDLNARAVQEIHAHAESGSENPLFLYLAYPAPHTPWLPSEAYQGVSGASMYGDFAAMVDGMVGDVLAALESSGLGEDTLVVFTSDNGPVWYEDDVERFDHDSSGGWRGMKGDAWEAGHRMPFIVRWPGQTPSGSVSDQLTGHLDLLATLADVAGVELADAERADSVSMISAWRGNASEERIRSSLLVLSSGNVLAARAGPWKFIPTLGSAGFSQPRRVEPEDGEPNAQLYDLQEDPGESRNLAGTNGDRLEAMRQLLEDAR